MISLKAFGDELAPLLGLTSAALYERQRALVRIGELPEPAKGRGHGLPATPETVAILLTAVMVTDNLSETDIRVHQLAKAHYRLAQDRSGGRCKLTGKAFFVDAVVAILGSERLTAQISRITVHRADSAAQIFFWPDPECGPESLPYRDPEVSQFGRMSDYPSRVEVAATLWGPTVERIQFLLRRAQQKGEANR